MSAIACERALESACNVESRRASAPGILVALTGLPSVPAVVSPAPTRIQRGSARHRRHELALVRRQARQKPPTEAQSGLASSQAANFARPIDSRRRRKRRYSLARCVDRLSDLLSDRSGDPARGLPRLSCLTSCVSSPRSLLSPRAMSARSIAFTVTGCVQGVGFRDFTQRSAQEHGVSGCTSAAAGLMCESPPRRAR